MGGFFFILFGMKEKKPENLVAKVFGIVLKYILLGLRFESEGLKRQRYAIFFHALPKGTS